MIQSLDLAPNGKTMVVGNSYGFPAIIDLVAGKRLNDEGDLDVEFKAIQLIPGSSQFVTGSKAGVQFWNSKNGRAGKVGKIKDGYIEALAVSPDGKTLAAVGSKMALIDIATAKVRIIPGEEFLGLESVAFTADGKSILAAEGSRVFQCDVNSARIVAASPLDRHGGRCSSFSRDGSILATGQAAKAVHVFKIGLPSASK